MAVTIDTQLETLYEELTDIDAALVSLTTSVEAIADALPEETE